jgi:hypothetical protein
VQDLLPTAAVAEIMATDWMSLHLQRGAGVQETWLRRQVVWSDPTAQRYSSYIDACLPEINQALGTEFGYSHGFFWVDLPGFEVGLHTDGHRPTAMQLYWTVPGPEWGTGFYRYKRQDSMLYQFESQPNSGYIMLNHSEPDGSQPLQWHAMLNPVPEGHIRVTSYWSFA